jgi:hypothetical protein
MRRAFLAIFAAISAIAVPASAQPARQTPTTVAVDGTEFVATLADGRVLRSRDLVGAVLDLRVGGRPMRVRIAAVEPDPLHRRGTVWLHTLESATRSGAWVNVCNAGPDGRRQAFPLAAGEAGGTELSCTGGAIAKCVRFGYHRWATDAADGAMASLHAACVRMVRGDYGGAKGWTRNGMRIDLYDDAGVQRPDNSHLDAFEAGWNAEGAVCVHHVRVKENVTLAELEALYPALRGRTGAICTEEFARAHGAIVFNRSPL